MRNMPQNTPAPLISVAWLIDHDDSTLKETKLMQNSAYQGIFYEMNQFLNSNQNQIVLSAKHNMKNQNYSFYTSILFFYTVALFWNYCVLTITDTARLKHLNIYR